MGVNLPVVATLTRNIFIYQSVLAGFATKSFKIIFKIIFLRFYIRFLLDFEAYWPIIIQSIQCCLLLWLVWVAPRRRFS